jgi:ribosome-associated protein
LEEFATESGLPIRLHTIEKLKMTDENQTNEVPPEQPAEQPVEQPLAEVAPMSIRLDQFLQLCGVPTGGQAKLLIQSGEVTVNGEVETRRRKKLTIGDEVGLDGEFYDVAFAPDEEEEQGDADDA